MDNSATTKVCPAAVKAVLDALSENYGNPSSGHAAGRAAAKLLGESREALAAALGAEKDEIIFTSGGTESDNQAIMGAARRNARAGKHILTTAVEHDAVLNSMKELEKSGFEVEYLTPDGFGNLTPEKIAGAVREDTALVSIMLVNNETGCVFPVEAAARAIKQKNSSALLHVDAVQGFLKIPFKAKTLGADMISVSSHKIHGPKGAGALYIKKGLKLPPLIVGGGQEGGCRSGTEAMPAIAGFAAAVKEGYKNLKANAEHMLSLKEKLADLLAKRVPEAVRVGMGGAPHILSLSMPGYKSEVIMNYLDSKGICVSRGSACKKGRRSHVLQAMGLPDEIIDGSIRVSLSADNTEEEIEYFINGLIGARDSLFKVLG